MQLIMPMAGLGQRFIEAGYELPKSLIPVDGIPMFVRAVRELPSARRYVFVVHPEHVRRHQIDELIRLHFPDCRVVVAPGLTRGQACTVRLACDELDPARSVLVAACDNSHLYDAREFERLTRDETLDGLIWTYRRDPRVLVRPEAHGWVRVHRGTTVVSEVSCKLPISHEPLRDHAISGCFWFRTAELMQETIDLSVAGGQTINGEFYLDTVPNLMLRAGRRIEVFEVEKYVGWGTPQDLDDYRRWERYFRPIHCQDAQKMGPAELTPANMIRESA